MSTQCPVARPPCTVVDQLSETFATPSLTGEVVSYRMPVSDWMIVPTGMSTGVEAKEKATVPIAFVAESVRIFV